MPHLGLVEIFISHRKFVKFFYHTKCRICPNITLCNWLLKYHFFVVAPVKYTYFVIEAVIITHFFLSTIYFITRTHNWYLTYHTFRLTAVYVSDSAHSSIFFLFGVPPDQNLAILCDFT